jgi:hypothetical protein
MSAYTALRETSLAIADRLRAAFLADAQLNPLFGAGGHVVSLRTPKEMRTVQPNQVGLSLSCASRWSESIWTRSAASGARWMSRTSSR